MTTTRVKGTEVQADSYCPGYPEGQLFDPVSWRVTIPNALSSVADPSVLKDSHWPNYPEGLNKESCSPSLHRHKRGKLETRSPETLAETLDMGTLGLCAGWVQGRNENRSSKCKTDRPCQHRLLLRFWHTILQYEWIPKNQQKFEGSLQHRK